jgi:hypothetical protein
MSDTSDRLARRRPTATDGDRRRVPVNRPQAWQDHVRDDHNGDAIDRMLRADLLDLDAGATDQGRQARGAALT